MAEHFSGFKRTLVPDSVAQKGKGAQGAFGRDSQHGNKGGKGGQGGGSRYTGPSERRADDRGSRGSREDDSRGGNRG